VVVDAQRSDREGQRRGGVVCPQRLLPTAGQPAADGRIQRAGFGEHVLRDDTALAVEPHHAVRACGADREAVGQRDDVAAVAAQRPGRCGAQRRAVPQREQRRLAPGLRVVVLGLQRDADRAVGVAREMAQRQAAVRQPPLAGAPAGGVEAHQAGVHAVEVPLHPAALRPRRHAAVGDQPAAFAQRQHGVRIDALGGPFGLDRQRAGVAPHQQAAAIGRVGLGAE
jgi:hypothetical protein